MRKILLIVSIFCLFLTPVSAVLSVSGESIYEIKPDIIYLTFLVEKDGLTAQEAQEVHKKTVNQVLEVLQKNEIVPERIKSDNYTLYPIYPDDKKEKVIYRAGIRVKVEIYQVSELGKIIDDVLNVGNTKIEKIAFDLKSEQEAKKEALKLALNEAKTKADLMANELGIQLVLPVSVNEKTEVVYEGKNELKNITSFPRNKVFIKAQTNIVFETKAKE